MNVETLIGRNGETVLTELTDEQALELLKAHDNSFAGRLINAYHELWRFGPRKGTRRGWTTEQRFWGHKMAYESQAQQNAEVEAEEDSRWHAERDNDTPTVRVNERSLELFRTASGRGLRNPKIVFTVDGCDLVLRLAGSKARYPGSINVTSGGSYRQNTWYGRIHTDGRWEPSRECTPAVSEFLVAFASDPVMTAHQYGRKTGQCCFCGKRLTVGKKDNGRALYSTDLGYGPDCAKTFGMPWGLQAARQFGLDRSSAPISEIPGANADEDESRQIEAEMAQAEAEADHEQTIRDEWNKAEWRQSMEERMELQGS